ncbi:MAG: SMC-Scp complex subunit ScpB [Syntrophomonadaceae bacterium]|nr:SMC-Scp complex subunit ScpB [Syntrophomonadaceae bacterium]
MLMRDEIKGAIEAILFVRSGRVGLDEIVEILEVPLFDVIDIMREIMAEYDAAGKGLRIREVNDGYVMVTNPEYSDYLIKMAEPQKKRLSPAAMETLAIIAYSQPVTRAEIERVRGVKSERIIANLLEKDLIAEAGVKAVIGRPLLYETTEEFLQVFGLVSLQDLPPMEEEPDVV